MKSSNNIEPIPYADLPEEVQTLFPAKEAPDNDGGYTSDSTFGTEGKSVPAQVPLNMALAKVRDGESRNKTGFWLGCQLRDNGYTQAEAEDALLKFRDLVPPTNTKGVKEPYTLQVVLDTLKQVYSRDARGPWAAPDEVPIGFELHTVDEFLALPVPEENWIVERHVGTGGITIIAGAPKAGKSTLTVGGVVRSIFKEEPFLGLKARKVRTALLCFQERRIDIQNRLRKFEIPKEVLVYEGSTRRMPDRAGALERVIKRYDLELVVIDTLANFWQIKDENNSIEVGKALQEIRDIARDTDCAIILVHHTRKAGGSSGMGIRGSGDLLAEADNAIVLTKNGKNREIEVTSRWCEEYKLLIKLEGTTYVSLGSPQSQDQSERQVTILEIISEEPGLTSSEVSGRLIDLGHSVSPPTISRDLNTLKKAGKVEAHGSKPYRYHPVDELGNSFFSL